MIPERSNQGFSLIETAVVLAIMGIALSTLLPLLQRWRETYGKQQDAVRQEHIFFALANFAKREGRLPLPSEIQKNKDWGLERKARRQNFPCGALPFKTLGLTEAHAYNSRGHLIGYFVHPNMTSKLYGSATGKKAYCQRNDTIFFHSIESLNFSPDPLQGERNIASARKKHDPVVVVLVSSRKPIRKEIGKDPRRSVSWEMLLDMFKGENKSENMHDWQKHYLSLNYITKRNLGASYGYFSCEE
jgi:prepilin-type N-terminal cleavage/methylation domain-containing protein